MASESSTAPSSASRRESLPASIQNSQNLFRTVMASMSGVLHANDDDDDDYVAPALAARRGSGKDGGAAVSRRQSLMAGLNILESFNEPAEVVVSKSSSESKEKLGSSLNLGKLGVRGSVAALNGSPSSSSATGNTQTSPPVVSSEKARLTGDQREEIKVCQRY